MALPIIARTVIIGAARRILGRAGVEFDTGIGITLQANVRGAGRNIEKLMREHDAIMAVALNKSARAARTVTARELANLKGVPQKVLRKRIQSFKASPRKKPIRASLWVGTSKPITANELTGQVSLSASGNIKIGRRTFKGAFPARMPGGHRGIFTRRPGATHRKRPDGQRTQLPIEESIVQLMPEARDISRRAAERAIETVYPKEMARLMQLRADRWRL